MVNGGQSWQHLHYFPIAFYSAKYHPSLSWFGRDTSCRHSGRESYLIVAVIYRPGSHPVDSMFFDKFTSAFERVASMSAPVLIVGDNNNNNASVFILRRLHPDDNDNESSPPCEQRCITFNDGQRVQLARPELPAPHYICTYRLLPTTPHHRPGIITPDLLPVPIYRPRKDR